jgi:uncharacterized sodium:solute symporter family permease YidK
MSVTTAAPPKPLITGGLTAVAVAAAGEFAGISLVVGGAPIPVFGFAVLTAIFSVVGLVLARSARRPRTAVGARGDRRDRDPGHRPPPVRLIPRRSSP